MCNLQPPERSSTVSGPRPATRRTSVLFSLEWSLQRVLRTPGENRQIFAARGLIAGHPMEVESLALTTWGMLTIVDTALSSSLEMN